MDGFATIFSMLSLIEVWLYGTSMHQLLNLYICLLFFSVK